MMSKTEIEDWIKDLTKFKKGIIAPMKAYKADVIISVLKKVLKNE